MENENKNKLINVNHILVKTEKEALELKQRIRGGDKFVEMARDHSICPSGKKGGSLGVMEYDKRSMYQSFFKVAMDGPVRKVLGPVKSDAGWHLIYVIDRWEGQGQGQGQPKPILPSLLGCEVKHE